MKYGTPSLPSALRRSSAALVTGIALLAARPAQSIEGRTPPLLLSLAGDSTVAAYDAKSPIRGWGEYLAPRLRRRVQIHNLARPGASSTSFIEQRLWDKVLRDKPTVVLIQFGHNDAGHAIDPLQTQSNLQYFVESARAQGATPVLVTPMQVRVFQNGKFIPSLTAYADAVRQVAARMGVAIIDLHALSGQLYEQLGQTRTEQLASGSDATHFNKLC